MLLYKSMNVTELFYITERHAVGIAAAVEAAIRDGRVGPGEHLPTVRAMASELAVSPATVAAAYRELGRRGLAVGAGAPRPPPPRHSTPPPPSGSGPASATWLGASPIPGCFRIGAAPSPPCRLTRPSTALPWSSLTLPTWPGSASVPTTWTPLTSRW